MLAFLVSLFFIWDYGIPVSLVQEFLRRQNRTVVCKMSVASLVPHIRSTLVTWHIPDSSANCVDNSLISERGQRFVVPHLVSRRSPFSLSAGVKTAGVRSSHLRMYNVFLCVRIFHGVGLRYGDSFTCTLHPSLLSSVIYLILDPLKHSKKVK